MKSAAWNALVVVGAVVLSGCGGSVPQDTDGIRSSAMQAAGFDGSFSSVHKDRIVFETPRAMADHADLVVRGTISDIQAGRRIIYDPVHFPDEADYATILAVEVDRILSGSDSVIPGSLIYVEIHSLDEPDLDRARSESPEEVILFLGEIDTSASDGIRVIDEFAGRSSRDAPVFMSYGPGFLYEEDNELRDFEEDLNEFDQAWSDLESLEDVEKSVVSAD